MHKPESSGGAERDFSDRDIPLGVILLSGLAITVFTVLTFVGIRALFHVLDRSGAATPHPMAEERVLPPEPRLQVDEPATWQGQLALERSALEGYAWVDQQAGVVRIPVERAMELLAERGLPARASAKP